jgi:hypothetical protein
MPVTPLGLSPSKVFPLVQQIVPFNLSSPHGVGNLAVCIFRKNSPKTTNPFDAQTKPSPSGY